MYGCSVQRVLISSPCVQGMLVTSAVQTSRHTIGTNVRRTITSTSQTCPTRFLASLQVHQQLQRPSRLIRPISRFSSTMLPSSAAVTHQPCQPQRPFSSSTTTDATVQEPDWTSAFIAIGGNLGHRARNISAALEQLRTIAPTQLELTATSFLYETTPVGSPESYASQPRFLNGVVEIRTCLDPLKLLDLLQQIENECGRVREGIPRNGPRTVDLDIIFYRDDRFKMNHERLILPHPRWKERGFVLAPLHDLVHPPCPSLTGRSQTDRTRLHSPEQPDRLHLLETIDDAIYQLGHAWAKSKPENREEIYRVIPFPTAAEVVPNSNLPAISDVWRWGQSLTVDADSGHFRSHLKTDSDNWPRSIPAPTHIMGILNLTPDSFSDGGQHTVSVEVAVKAAKAMWDQGADIIDVGGESTRPGSTPVSPQDELARILPVIQAIHQQYPRIKMSVDTYHPQVARMAVQAGCVMINDVCGGSIRELRPDSTKDECMLDVAAELNVPYICMHIRGTPQTMTSPGYLEYSDIKEVGQEQEARFIEALSPRPNSSAAATSDLPLSPSPHLLYRWNLIGDPGIGFAKTGAVACQILRQLSSVRPFDCFPLLVGTSRKGFISRMLKRGQDLIEARATERQTASPPSSTDSTTTTPPAISNVDRAWGTSATITAAIANGADIIRVHDVHEMRCVRDVADQIYK